MFLCYNSIDEGGDRVPVTILLIAVSLAMDAFAVSVSCGISVPGFGVRQAARVGLWFGLFQFLMPLAGWGSGHRRQRLHPGGGPLGGIRTPGLHRRTDGGRGPGAELWRRGGPGPVGAHSAAAVPAGCGH